MERGGAGRSRQCRAVPPRCPARRRAASGGFAWTACRSRAGLASAGRAGRAGPRNAPRSAAALPEWTRVLPRPVRRLAARRDAGVARAGRVVRRRARRQGRRPRPLRGANGRRGGCRDPPRAARRTGRVTRRRGRPAGQDWPVTGHWRMRRARRAGDTPPMLETLPHPLRYPARRTRERTRVGERCTDAADRPVPAPRP
jgi:hypothetical protein